MAGTSGLREAARRIARESRISQGLPVTIDDPRLLRDLAVLLASTTRTAGVTC
jgi:hypothetical protein